MLSTQNQITYDEKFDVLYYKIGDTSNSYGDEIDNKIILLKDIESDCLNGITVLDFLNVCIKDSEKEKILQKYFDVSNIIKLISTEVPM